jgi:hypothetical protein
MGTNGRASAPPKALFSRKGAIKGELIRINGSANTKAEDSYRFFLLGSITESVVEGNR